MEKQLDNLVEIRELRNSLNIFDSRKHAGLVLAGMLREYEGTDSIVFGIPAGGVPVAASISSELNLKLDLAVVSKITLPWNTEAGYGAVAFDGTVILNNELISSLGLTTDDIKTGIEIAKNKVERRYKKFRADQEFPDPTNKTSIIVDDGIASGYTMIAAINAMINKGFKDIVIAVPTAHLNSIEMISSRVNRIFCANVRDRPRFAVAEAYKNWCDVDENQLSNFLGD